MTEKQTLESLCQSRGVEYQGDGMYFVPSSDGTQKYTVRETPTPEEMVPGNHILECTCQAGLHGRMCKHVRLVASISAEYGEQMGYE